MCAVSSTSTSNITIARETTRDSTTSSCNDRHRRFRALFDLQAVASAAAAADGLSPAACAALRDLYRQASDELRRTLDRLPVAIVNLELEGAVPRDGGADEPRGRRPGEAPDRHRLDGTGV